MIRVKNGFYCFGTGHYNKERSPSSFPTFYARQMVVHKQDKA